MRAAVVTAFDAAPRYQKFPTPVPAGEHEMLVDVIAAGLHQRVRSQADGSHYTRHDELPLVPGIDGVGRGTDGVLRYFVLPDTTVGSMAEQTVIDLRRSVVLADAVDPVAVAAAKPCDVVVGGVAPASAVPGPTRRAHPRGNR